MGRLEKELATGRPRISRVFAGMLDKAKPGSEMKVIENATFFKERLMTDPIFVESLRRAAKKGVKLYFFLSPHSKRDHEEVTGTARGCRPDLYNTLCGAYAYGGITNLQKYFMISTTQNNKPITEEEALNMAKEFEEKVLGKGKYLLRVQGFFGRLFGMYHTVKR